MSGGTRVSGSAAYIHDDAADRWPPPWTRIEGDELYQTALQAVEVIVQQAVEIYRLEKALDAANKALDTVTVWSVVSRAVKRR